MTRLKNRFEHCVFFIFIKRLPNRTKIESHSSHSKRSHRSQETIALRSLSLFSLVLVLSFFLFLTQKKISINTIRNTSKLMYNCTYRHTHYTITDPILDDFFFLLLQEMMIATINYSEHQYNVWTHYILFTRFLFLLRFLLVVAVCCAFNRIKIIMGPVRCVNDCLMSFSRRSLAVCLYIVHISACDQCVLCKNLIVSLSLCG